MLVPAAGEARDQPRNLRQLTESHVVQEGTLAAERAHVVCVPLPEDEDVVGVPERDAVPAEAVDLPRHAGGVEKVKDDRVVEDAVAPDTVRRDPARRPGGQVKAVRPGWAQQ